MRQVSDITANTIFALAFTTLVSTSILVVSPATAYFIRSGPTTGALLLLDLDYRPPMLYSPICGLRRSR